MPSNRTASKAAAPAAGEVVACITAISAVQDRYQSDMNALLERYRDAIVTTLDDAAQRDGKKATWVLFNMHRAYNVECAPDEPTGIALMLADDRVVRSTSRGPLGRAIAEQEKLLRKLIINAIGDDVASNWFGDYFREDALPVPEARLSDIAKPAVARRAP